MAPKKKAVRRPAKAKAPARAAAKPAPKAAIKPVAKPMPKASKPAMPMGMSCCTPDHTEFCATAPCGCPLFGIMSTKAFWASTVLAFVVVFVFDLWARALLMGGLPPKPLMLLDMVVVGQLVLAMLYTALILLMGRTASWWGGFITGALAAAPSVVPFLFYPHLGIAIPMMMLLTPVLLTLAKGGLVGLAVTAVTRCKGCRGK
ncbi:MAG: hypothetical protein GC129_04410 [Proteobacteria bacterium]|nr:hypothetical protein [Pseudomonadota bacterium]